MKTKLLFLLTLFAALSIQCSRNDDDSNALSLPPIRPSVDNQDSTPEPKTGEVKYVPTLYPNGYASRSNARLVVDSLAVTVAPEFQYVVSWLDGSSANDWGSKVSEIWLHSDGRVYVGIPGGPKASLLCADDGWGGSYIDYWDLEYTLVQSAGQPHTITINGIGKGSHILEITNEAWQASEITFEFSGIQIEGTHNFMGSFTLDEKSPDEKYNLLAASTLTLEWD